MEASHHEVHRTMDDIGEALVNGSHISSVLSDVDVDAVYQAIAGHEQHIQHLNAELEDHRRVIRQLQYKKEQHLVEIRRCKGMITLAKRLPPEILASIFEECVEDGWTRTPLTVSHVCSNWRKAAAIPTVWSHLLVNFDARDPVNRTRLWLEKSQSTPLTIQLELNHSDLAQINRIMDLLTAEIGRWKILIIKSMWLYPINQILQLCNKSAPQLSSLSIEVGEELAADSEGHELVTLRNSALDAPQMRNLRLDRNLLPGSHIIPSSVTNLSLRLPAYSSTTRQSIGSIVRLLDELPTLEKLSIEVPTGSHQIFELDANAGHLIELPNLQSFTLIGLKNIFGVLPYLNLPVLGDLHLRSTIEYAQWDETGTWLERFLERSCAPIETLEIRDLGLDSATYDRIFPLLLQLKDLRLHDSDILDAVLIQLNGPDGLCPSLQHLDLRWCGRLSGRALVNLVRSRLPAEGEAIVGSKTIDEITVINCSFVKEEDILDLGQMTVCRLVYKGSDDFCHSFGCCDNNRYRRRLKQRLQLRPSTVYKDPKHQIVL